MAALMVPRPALCKVVQSSSVQKSVRHGSVFSPNPWDFSQKVKNFKDIPGPRALPVVGNVWKYYLGKYPLEDMTSLCEGYLKKYGPLVRERMFFGRTIVHVFDPLDMNKIYFMDRNHLPVRMSHRALGEYRKRMPEMYNSGGLGVLNGKEWRSVRLILGAQIRYEKSDEAFEMIAADLVDRINSKISLGSDVSLLPMLYDYTLECLGVVALGQRMGCFLENSDERLAQFVKCIGVSQKSVFYTENLPRILTRKHAKQLAECQNYIHMFLWRLVDEIITNKQSLTKDGADEPVAIHKSLLAKIILKDPETREGRTLITDTFQGGIHSTAHILAFALYHLARNPQVQKDVRASLMEAFPNSEDKISSQPLDQKIKNVIRETMRLNPPTIGTGRVLPEDLVMSRYRVPKGTMCILHHQIASRQKQNFPNPDEFIPDRFNDPNMSKSAIIANSPFALGKRSCPGRIIALTELGIGLSKILRHFELSYKGEPVGMENYLINQPNRDIKVTFTPLK